MSYSQALGIYRRRNPVILEEYSNSHGTAPPVWEAMAGKYLGVTEAYSYPNKGWMQLGSELWSLWRAPQVKLEHRLVFLLTFDRAYVARENFAKMAAAIRVFLEDFPPKVNYVNHWDSIASLFESAPQAPRVGLYCTSVGENPFEGEWDESRERHRLIDWGTTFEIFEEVRKLEECTT
jgi:hypothetical protein